MTVREHTAQKIQNTRNAIESVESQFHESGESIPPAIELGLKSLRKIEREMTEELAEMDREVARRKARRLATRTGVQA